MLISIVAYDKCTQTIENFKHSEFLLKNVILYIRKHHQHLEVHTDATADSTSALPHHGRAQDEHRAVLSASSSSEAPNFPQHVYYQN